jgi:hypothetical protein
LYEQQLIEYLNSFHIPEDYQHRILEAHRKLQSAYDDVTKQKAALERRLQRAKELYEWGHKSKEEYWADYNMIQQQLQSLAPAKDQARGLERLALFLKDISEVWKQADEQQRNRLAKQLFDIVWIKDKKVLAVTPRPEFKPFFDLQYEGLSQGVLHIRPRGASKPLVILLLETYPVLAPFYLTIPSRPSRKLSPYLWPEIIARHKTESLRALAEEYGASRESVRRALVSAHQHCTASI